MAGGDFDFDEKSCWDAWPTQARFWLEWGYFDLVNSVIPTGTDHRKPMICGVEGPAVSDVIQLRGTRESSKCLSSLDFGVTPLLYVQNRANIYLAHCPVFATVNCRDRTNLPHFFQEYKTRRLFHQAATSIDARI